MLEAGNAAVAGRAGVAARALVVAAASEPDRQAFLMAGASRAECPAPAAPEMDSDGTRWSFTRKTEARLRHWLQSHRLHRMTGRIATGATTVRKLHPPG